MEPKKIKKLVLKKEIISQLEQHNLKGGCTNSVTCGNPDVSAGQSCLVCGSELTYCNNNKPDDCHTIGHDDGNGCCSESAGWCWCYGR